MKTRLTGNLKITKILINKYLYTVYLNKNILFYIFNIFNQLFKCKFVITFRNSQNFY